MRKYFILWLVGLSAVALQAAPQASTTVEVSHATTSVPLSKPTAQVPVLRPATSGGISHPVTTATVFKPVTSGVLSKPTTTEVVSKPTTQVPTLKPNTQVSVSRPATPFGGTMGGMSSNAGFRPTFKNATNFSAKTAAPAEEPPAPQAPAQPSPAPGVKVPKLGSGEAGLGMKDSQEAAKDAAAAEKKPEAESANLSIQDVLKKTQMPAGLADALKEKNNEAKQKAGKK